MRISLRIDTHFKDLTLRLPESMSGTRGIWSFLENLHFWGWLRRCREDAQWRPWLGHGSPWQGPWEWVSSVPSSEPQHLSENRGGTLANCTGGGSCNQHQGSLWTAEPGGAGGSPTGGSQPALDLDKGNARPDLIYFLINKETKWFKKKKKESKSKVETLWEVELLVYICSKNLSNMHTMIWYLYLTSSHTTLIYSNLYICIFVVCFTKVRLFFKFFPWVCC